MFIARSSRIALLVRSRRTLLLFYASLVGVVLQDIGIFVVAGAGRAGNAVPIVLQGLVPPAPPSSAMRLAMTDHDGRAAYIACFWAGKAAISAADSRRSAITAN